MSAAEPPRPSEADELASPASDAPGAAGGEPVCAPGEPASAPDASACAPEGGGTDRRRPAVIKQRRDFVLAANRGQRLGLPGLNLQARRRRADEPSEAPVRVGYTCSKKVGGAVQRNRAKRRLRAAAAEVLPGVARPGWDYVLIGRRDATAARPFPELLADLSAGVARLHAREDKADAARARGEPVPAPSPRPPRKPGARGKPAKPRP